MGRYDHLFGKELATEKWSWDSSDALLYAVGVGAGLDDPLQELQFSTENTPGAPQQVIPSFITLMGMYGGWAEACGWDDDGLSPVGLVHGEQSVTLVRSIPVSGQVHLSRVMNGVYDKGSGALIIIETRATDATSGDYIGSSTMSLFALGRGGFGGPRGPEGVSAWNQPDREPDINLSLSVGLNQSLIYRLSGDHHPHGTYPPRARADGFERPIYYGLGSFGVTCRALLRGLCDGDAGRFGHMDARFSKPVHPGDRLGTRIWRTDDGAQFQVLANGDRVVLDRGVFRFR